METESLVQGKVEIFPEFLGIEKDFSAITNRALEIQQKEQTELWKLCCAASLIIGNFEEGMASEFAGYLGISVATVQFYAKAWRVRQYVKDESVPCSYGIEGVVNANTVLRNLTMTHYGMIHRKVFVSKRDDKNQMTYIPIMTPRDTLSWLAECIEPLTQEGKRLSPQALLALMIDSPDTIQWWEEWGNWKSKLQDFILKFSERMPIGLRQALAELIQKDWE